jgi:hypothetical protein
MPPKPTPISLSDDQMRVLLDAAQPIARNRRADFLARLAAALRGRELGDGIVGRAIREAQREFYDPPLDARHGTRPSTPASSGDHDTGLIHRPIHRPPASRIGHRVGASA